MAATITTARVRGLELAYETVGSGPAVVFLHGYPFNRTMWREQTEALREKYRVITPDLRGLGETTGTDEPATMEEMARDVVALLDELRVGRVTLCGLSMGGYVALAFYRRFPLRVRALVLADTKAQADTEEARRNRAEQAQKILRDGMQSIADDFTKKVLTSETLTEKPETVARVREMILKTPPEGAAQALKGMALRPDQTAFLEQILAPTLILVGSEDEVTPPGDAQLMHREIRGARLEIIEGASHLSNLERPLEFNRVLLDFITALEP